MEKLDRLLDFIEDTSTRSTSGGLNGCTSTPWRTGRFPICADADLPARGCRTVPYAEAFDDPEKMLYNELVRTVGGPARTRACC